MFQPGQLLPVETAKARAYKEHPIHHAIPRQIIIVQNQLQRKRQQKEDGCPVVFENPNSEVADIAGAGFRENPGVTSWNSLNEFYSEKSTGFDISEDRRSHFNTAFFTGSSAKEDKRVILEDMTAAREAKRKASEAANAPEIVTPKEKQKMASIAAAVEVKKPVRLEYQIRGTQKWKSKRLIRPEQIEADRLSVPVERPTVVRFRGVPYNKGPNRSGSVHGEGGMTPVSRLAESRSLGFTRSTQSVRSLELQKKIEMDIRKIVEDDDEGIAEGFEVSREVTDNLTYEDRLILERWEMGLEDDVVGVESDTEEAKL
ncbi:hypothetical protein RvY_05519 [Ramazzottius varieornatus]|uniref:Uncharacterized protein n=1 Tax=Ramazzottius varieornatus TaxID=947166 RepID=A0A1D1UYD0_RAMVA|nr:hypothetical protein RvY_05519 [Ramazzottius varieornatus]